MSINKTCRYIIRYRSGLQGFVTSYQLKLLDIYFFKDMMNIVSLLFMVKELRYNMYRNCDIEIVFIELLDL